MKLLVLGKNGQVGWELNRSLLPLGEVIALDRKEGDLSRLNDLRKVIQEVKPSVIVNAAAYTAVDKAESEEELATLINGVAPGVIAEEARKIDALLIHYSTDYVFDGKKGSPYTEEDDPNPINVYGKTKLAGEDAIQAVGGDYIILRTSWVYAARGQNFLRSILRLVQEKEELRIVSDQVGSPTWARFIADITSQVIIQSKIERENTKFKSSLYHLCAEGNTSWYDFTNAIIKLAQNKIDIKAKNILPINSNEYKTKAIRPKNTCLLTDKLKEHYKIVMPEWYHALKLCINDAF